MADLPNDLPEWCTDPDDDPTADIVAPSAGIRAEGWNPGDGVPAQFLNWWQNLVGQWLVMLRALLTKNWRESYVKADVDGDVWVQTCFASFGAGIHRSVLIGAHDWTNPLVYYRLGAEWAVAGSYSGSGDYYLGVAYGADLFCAITPGGHAETSPTGNTWTDRGAMDGISPRAICFGAGLFVAVGDLGVIENSADGITFDNCLNVAGADFLGVAFHGAALGVQFVAVGEAGRLYSSEDGDAWSSRASGFGATDIRSVTYDAVHGVWVAVGEAGKVATSTNGTAWTLLGGIGALGLTNAGCDGQGTVIVSESTGLLYVSYDGGVSWAKACPDIPITAQIGSVDYFEGSWWIAGSKVLPTPGAALLQGLQT
jgi:hypothetical protein